MQGVACDERKIGLAGSADSQHPEREITGNDVGTAIAEWLARRCGSRGEIEYDIAGYRGHRVDDCSTPEASLAECKYVVGEVVTGRDVVKHRRHIGGGFTQISATHALSVP